MYNHLKCQNSQITVNYKVYCDIYLYTNIDTRVSTTSIQVIIINNVEQEKPKTKV